MEFFETIETCRAMRHLRPDEVPEELLDRVLRAATCAPSPGNSQGWDFVVVRDRERRSKIGELVRDAVLPLLPDPDTAPDRSRRAMLRGARHLADNAAAVPVWVFVGGRPVYPAARPSVDWIAPAVYPAAQNLVLAARAVGLGTVFTAYHSIIEDELGALLGLPPDFKILVTVPMGWPARPFGPLARKPAASVVHWDRW